MNIQIFHFCFYCQPLIEQKQKAMKNYNNIKSISTLLLITLLMFGSKKVNAQTRLNNKHTVSFGTGLISTAGMNYYSNLSQNEDFVAEISGGIHFKYEYHLSEKFSLGISLGYVEVKGEWKGDENVYIYQWGPNLPDPNQVISHLIPLHLLVGLIGVWLKKRKLRFMLEHEQDIE